jgi:hypothetical protein
VDQHEFQFQFKDYPFNKLSHRMPSGFKRRRSNTDSTYFHRTTHFIQSVSSGLIPNILA